MVKLVIGLLRFCMKSFQNRLIKLILFINFCSAQSILHNSKEFKILNFSAEKDFSLFKYSIIGNPRWNDISTFKNDSQEDYIYTKFKNISRIGIDTKNNDFSLYLQQIFSLSHHLYYYLDARLVSNVSMFENFSGLPRGIKRFGLESGEVNQSGIGFQNKWLIMEYGRGSQNWGSGNGIELAISNQSHSFDHVLLKKKKNKFKYRYFHGFLENINDQNRYILGKGIEYTNLKSLRLSLSEIVIYSGENRPIDLNYLNPISSHLEIEMNSKGNMAGNDLGNAIWNLSIDFKLSNELRLMSNFLIDELTIDKSERDQNKAHGLGFSSKLVISPKHLKNLYFTLSYVAVGTKTFRHRNLEGTGYNNFVYLNKPLGWKHGSDSHLLEFQFNQKICDKFLNKISISWLEVGDESININSYDPYQNYLKSNFPSGIKKSTLLIYFDMEYYIIDNLSLKIHARSSEKQSITNREIVFGFDYFFNMNK